MTIYDGTKIRLCYKLLKVLAPIKNTRPSRGYTIEMTAGDITILKDILKEYPILMKMDEEQK